jgi:DNA-binding NarL/FixJ family response regulator
MAIESTVLHVSPEGDCWCEVCLAQGEVGVVKALRFLDPARDGSIHVGRTIGPLLEELGAYQAFQSVDEVLSRRASAADVVLLPRADGAFRIVSAREVNPSTARVTVRHVETRLLAALIDAKAKGAAEARGLSDRERQVLTLLLRGRGVEDIATMLGITPRTVKFHQANVLQKLGADSRLDLLRVVL